jgi:hypothetical protein
MIVGPVWQIVVLEIIAVILVEVEVVDEVKVVVELCTLVPLPPFPIKNNSTLTESNQTGPTSGGENMQSYIIP